MSTAPNLVDSCGWPEYSANGANADFFAPAIEDTDRLIVPTLCLFEVCKRVLQRRNESDALRAIAIMRQGQLVDRDAHLALSAARLSADAKLAMADSVILASARQRQGPRHPVVVLGRLQLAGAGAASAFGKSRTVGNAVATGERRRHALLEDPATAIEQEFSPESGQMNPFLHLSLHLAVAEQVSIRPAAGDSFCLPDAALAGRRSRGCARDPRMPRRDDLACRAPWPGDGRERLSRVPAARRRHLIGILAAPRRRRALWCWYSVPPTRGWLLQ